MKKIFFIILGLSFLLSGCSNKIIIDALKEDNYRSRAHLSVIAEEKAEESKVKEKEKHFLSFLEKGFEITTESFSSKNYKFTIKPLGIENLMEYLGKENGSNNYTIEIIRKENDFYLISKNLVDKIEIFTLPDDFLENILSQISIKGVEIEEGVKVELDKDDLIEIFYKSFEILKDLDNIERPNINNLKKTIDLISRSEIDMKLLIELHFGKNKKLSNLNTDLILEDDELIINIVYKETFLNYEEVKEIPTVISNVEKSSNIKRGVFNLEKNIAILNNKIKKLENNIFIVNGTTLVPLRKVADLLEVESLWNAEEKTILLSYNNVDLLFYYETGKVYRNEEELESVVFNSEGTVYVPLRFVVEQLGGTIEYDEKTKDIIVVFE